MFCPNCGTSNEDSATTCKKCGFNLKSAIAPKFKGTMVMQGSPSVVGPKTGQTAIGHPAAPGTPVPRRPSGALSEPAVRPAMKQTMLGVAPPAAGAVEPSPGAAIPFPSPPPPQVSTEGPAAAKPSTPTTESSSVAVAQVGSPTETSATAPTVAVAALTESASPSPAAAPEAPHAGSPERSKVARTLPDVPAGASPTEPERKERSIATNRGGALSQRGIVGRTRDPVVVTALSLATGGVFWLGSMWAMLNELNDYRRKNDIAPGLFLVPIVGWLELWKLPEKVLDTKRMAGIKSPEVVHPVLYLVLGIFFLANDLNEIWKAAGATPPSTS